MFRFIAMLIVAGSMFVSGVRADGQEPAEKTKPQTADKRQPKSTFPIPILGPIPVTGKHDGQGTTTSPNIICKLILLSHGSVECQLTLKKPLQDTRWVQFVLRDGTENRILSTTVAGTNNKDGSLRTYRVTMKRTSIKNSYFLVEKSASKVLLETVELEEYWTHGQDLLSWTEEHAMGSFGVPEYDSRKEKGDDDKSYVLTWRFGGIKDLSIHFKEKKAVSHWRGSPSK